MFTSALTVSRRLIALPITIAVSAAIFLGSAFAPVSAQAAGYYDYLLPPYGSCGTGAEGDMSKTYTDWTAGARCLVNEARNKARLDSYATYYNLLDSSYHKASDISVCQPDYRNVDAVHHACNQPMDKWIKWPRTCASYGYAENYYIGSGSLSTARAAVSWWLNSPGHRAALLSPSFTGHGLMYSGPTTYPGIGPNARIWIHHMAYCT
ncbi:MAG: hypothetical protein QOI64_901 [Solirubrobacteraceae bacterium]|jgi:hypothetical protein|nr:hypothetical protein [Solirubrobacteraceae bacterium]